MWTDVRSLSWKNGDNGRIVTIESNKKKDNFNDYYKYISGENIAFFSY